MEIVEAKMGETLAAYTSVPEDTRASVEYIISGAQPSKGSRHLVETAQMVSDLFPRNRSIEEHPGAILPYVDLQEVFGEGFVKILESHIAQEFAREDASTRQKITFKFLQALFEGKIEKWISIEIKWNPTNLFLPQEIVEKSAPDKIQEAQRMINTQNNSNVADLVAKITAAHSEVMMIIASKEQVGRISQELWIPKKAIIIPENNKVYLVDQNGMKQISK